MDAPLSGTGAPLNGHTTKSEMGKRHTASAGGGWPAASSLQVLEGRKAKGSVDRLELVEGSRPLRDLEAQ